MYAVIRAGGKQHKVKPGDVIEVELMHADGDTVELHPLLVVNDDGKTHVGKDAQKAVVVAKSVSSPPLPTPRPGWIFVPRWRTMIEPAVTC